MVEVKSHENKIIRLREREEKMLFGSRMKKKSMLSEVDKQRVVFETSDVDLMEKMKLISFTAHDLKVLKTLYPIVEKNMHKIVQKFYDTIMLVPELELMIQKHSSIDRLKGVLFPHLLELFSGVIDEQFVQKRLTVAHVHYKIGLKPAWYLAAFQGLQRSLLDIVCENVEDPNEWMDFIPSITRILSLEQQLVLEAYETETRKGMQESFVEGQAEIQKRVISVSDQLVGSSQEANALIETLVHSSEAVYSISTKGHEQAEETKEIGEVGQQTLKNLLEKVEMIARNIEGMNKIVQNVENSSNQITGVVKIVEEIAEQTNLLALNSAIEAVRAGEHGRGFAVVADEVRHLADQTKSSISTIHGLVQTSNQYTQELIQSLGTVTEEVKETSETSQKTYRDFESIIQAMNNNLQTNRNIQKQVESQHDALRDIDEVMEVVVKSADRLHEIVEQ